MIIILKSMPPRLVLAAVLLLPALAHGEGVYWTTRAVLKDFFQDSRRVTYETVVTNSVRPELEKRLGYTPEKEKYVVFVARTEGRIDGFAVVDDEPGQHRPITFGFRFDASGVLTRSEVMAYREGYGEEIREARFRRQFLGKDAASPLDDVVAVSGATISSRAMKVATQRAAVLVELVRGRLAEEAREHARAHEPATGPTL